MTTLSLIIITHNSAAWLPALSQTWQASLSAADLPHEILIADAASDDSSLDVAAQVFPAARILTCPNIGFSATANHALRVASAPWTLLCNPDLTFPTEFASILLQYLRTPESSQHIVTAPRLLNPDGTPQHSIGRFPTVRSILRDQFRPRPARKYLLPPPGNACHANWASAACLLIQREPFLKISDGGFDEKYFLHVEDVDLQRRLADAGHPTFFFPDLTVVHHNPNSSRKPSPEIQRYAARGLLRYFAKFSPDTSLPIFRLLALFSRRLSARETLAPVEKILRSPTGP